MLFAEDSRTPVRNYSRTGSRTQKANTDPWNISAVKTKKGQELFNIYCLVFFWIMSTKTALAPTGLRYPNGLRTPSIIQGSQFALWVRELFREQMQIVREHLANRWSRVLREQHCCSRNLLVRELIHEQFANKPSLLFLGDFTKLAYFGGHLKK